MLKILCLVFSLFIIFSLNNQGICFASSPNDSIETQKISINEIAWMGTNVSYSDEWIELYNTSKTLVNLDKWKIETPDKSITILLKGKIPAKGFFLLERTNDETVKEVKADLIYKGGLNNNGKHLKLINAKGELVDNIDCSNDWFAGDNKTKQTMERINPLKNGNSSINWQTSQGAEGTPKAQNSSGAMKKNDEQSDIGSDKTNNNLISVPIEKKNNNKNNLELLIGSIVSIFSAATILTLKKTLNQNNQL
ncbi:MAG: lamin tail domain-containing protein [Patescibacteria group bacterium]|nr:lamin tail domain-containing protein [Patescibacteria group bacterium]